MPPNHDKRRALTPEALSMMDTIARTGSFAAAAREMGRVPSALTYSVRQLEDALDVLLFDRSSRQAVLTSAGQELLHEGRRLLQELDAVANRVRRIATGWESELTLAVDDAIARVHEQDRRQRVRPSTSCDLAHLRDRHLKFRLNLFARFDQRQANFWRHQVEQAQRIFEWGGIAFPE